MRASSAECIEAIACDYATAAEYNPPPKGWVYQTRTLKPYKNRAKDYKFLCLKPLKHTFLHLDTPEQEPLKTEYACIVKWI